MAKKIPKRVARQLEEAERLLALNARFKRVAPPPVPVILFGSAKDDSRLLTPEARRRKPSAAERAEARKALQERIREIEQQRHAGRRPQAIYESLWRLLGKFPDLTLRDLARAWPRGGKRRKEEATLLKVYEQILAHPQQGPHRWGKDRHAAALKIDVRTFSARRKELQELQARGFLRF